MFTTTAHSSLIVMALTLAGAAALEAQTALPATASPLSASLIGRDSYEQYCAPCHGPRGRGDGTVAAALKTRPADLTALAIRNDGAYPADRVRETVTGTRRLPAHGTSDMPTWGPIFRAFEGDARARVRVANLVTFIETLQAPSTGLEDRGSRLFRTYCASCHGTDARGSAPLADQRHAPPDLTRFAARNGGLFPSERVRRIIDGRDVASHGDRDMPVWGNAFTRTEGGLSTEEVKARIDAIVRYLDGIQERGTY